MYARSSEPSEGRLWPLLFPVCYAAHLAEEYWGGSGFADWFSAVIGGNLSVTEFLWINAVAFPVMLLAAVVSINVRRFAWITVTLATIVLINGSAHLLATILTVTYSPGIVTGALLYIPLGAYGFRRINNDVREEVGKAITIGVFIHGIIAVIAYL